MARLLPQSLAGQMILLLIGALLLAQVLNAYFLLGERRFVARATHYGAVINRMVDALALAPPDVERVRLPLVLLEPPALEGAVFISRHQRTTLIDDGRDLPRYAEMLRDRLTDAGLTPLNTSALVHRLGTVRDAPEGDPPAVGGRQGSPMGRPSEPPSGGGPAMGNDSRPPPPPGAGGRPRPGAGPGAPDAGPGPDRGGAAPFGEQSSGPSSGPSLGRAGDGVYHPSAPPDRFGMPQPGFEEIVFSAEIAPGIWLNAMAPHYSTEAISMRAILSTGFSIFIAGFAAAILARRIAKPIGELSDAADALGRGDAGQIVPETGPRDVQRAARSFNTMQERLTRLLEDQRATLRAIGHDLRTPLTSLRIRAEDLPDGLQRDRFIAMIDDLTTMTGEILSWAKDVSTPEPMAKVDLASLVDTVVEGYAERGDDVEFVEPVIDVVAVCRRTSLRRALTNLIDNALKYAGQARISLALVDGDVAIRVDDDGPGIPDGELAAVLKPFTRLETSRNRETGGVGLGLSIAHSIIAHHGGRLSLHNRVPKGLRVTLTLPLGGGT